MIRCSRILLLACGLMAGCGSSPKAQFYALSGPAAAASSVASTYSVSVGPVNVPDIVDRPQLVVRAAGNQVELAEFARWAEPLRSAIPRVIAANLAASLPQAAVSAYSPDADYRVAVDIQSFESVRGDSVTIDALWTVRPAKGGAPRSGRSVAREAAGKDYDALAAAHSKALAAVSQDIARAVDADQAQRPK